jgi:hypothetical protein
VGCSRAAEEEGRSADPFLSPFWGRIIHTVPFSADLGAPGPVTLAPVVGGCRCTRRT